MSDPTQVTVGSSRKLRCRFDIDGVMTDPSTITLRVMDPELNESVYTYAALQLTRASVGDFNKNVTFNTQGRYEWRWEALGLVVAADEGIITARRSAFS